jgi:hypothetical protein
MKVPCETKRSLPVDARSVTKIFISYRREDSAYATGFIRDQLVAALPGSEVFFDVDSIPYGVDFRAHLEGCVAVCDYLVVVIGKRWLTVCNGEGQRRLDNPNDAVRVEVETALNRGIPLIPVFLDGMDVPAPDQFPDSLRGVVDRNAIFVRPPPDFNQDVSKLVQSLKRQIAADTTGSISPLAQASANPVFRSPLVQSILQRRSWLIAAICAMALAVSGWSFFADGDNESAYVIQDSYLFEDHNPTPLPWHPHNRMLNGGFKLPLEYVHWVIHLKHGKRIKEVMVPIECRLLDGSEEIVRFSGVTGKLPDKDSPNPGVSEWILSFGAHEQKWHVGTYTIQLNSPTESTSISFEVFPPSE